MATVRLPHIFAIAITAVALLGVLIAAEARERHTTVTGSNGKTATRNVARSGGTQATVTGPNGKSAARSTTKTGTGSSTTVTTSGGKSTTVDVTRRP